jgi:hypothetical protein
LRPPPAASSLLLLTPSRLGLRIGEFGQRRISFSSGDLALTSTRSPDGTVTAEVARRQADGTWLWVIDKFSNA